MFDLDSFERDFNNKYGWEFEKFISFFSPNEKGYVTIRQDTLPLLMKQMYQLGVESQLTIDINNKLNQEEG